MKSKHLDVLAYLLFAFGALSIIRAFVASDRMNNHNEGSYAIAGAILIGVAFWHFRLKLKESDKG